MTGPQASDIAKSGSTYRDHTFGYKHKQQADE
jgi:hypothetical protein